MMNEASKPFRMAPLQKLTVKPIENPAERAALDARLKRSEESASMSSRISTPSIGSWPPDVLEFAAQRQVTDLLDPLLLSLGRIFPAAQSIRVRLEEDPEIRADRHIAFDVRVCRADVPDFGAAKRRWHEELFRLCPAPSVCLFRLIVVRVA